VAIGGDYDLFVATYVRAYLRTYTPTYRQLIGSLDRLRNGELTI